MSISICKEEILIQGHSSINLESRLEKRVPVPPQAYTPGTLASCLNGLLSVVVPRLQETTSIVIPVQGSTLGPFVPRVGDMVEPHKILIPLPGFAADDVHLYVDDSRNLYVEGEVSSRLGF